MINYLDYDLWGIEEIANELKSHMKINQKIKKLHENLRKENQYYGWNK